MPRWGKPMAPKHRRYTDRGAAYVIPGHSPPPLPSITTLLDAYPQPSLDKWRLHHTAKWAVENWGIWGQLDHREAINLIKNSAYNYTETRANLGTLVHDLIEKGATLNDTMTEEAVGYMVAAAHIIAKLETVDARELTVFNPAVGYAGTGDLYGYLPDGRYVVIDWKTGKHLGPKNLLQLYALAAADFRVDDDGNVSRQPRPDVGWVCQLRADGDYTIKEVDFSNDIVWKKLTNAWLGVRLLWNFDDGRNLWQ